MSNNPEYAPRGRRSPLTDPDELPRRGHPVREPGDPRGTDMPRRGQRIGGSSMPPNVDDDFAKRGKPVAEPVGPSQQPASDTDDLPPRRPSNTASQPPASADEGSDPLPRRRQATESGDVVVQAQPPAPVPEVEVEPEPEDPDWNFEVNRQRLKKLLIADWGHWGREHRQEFEDTIVEAVEAVYSTVKTSEAEPEPED